MLWIPFSNWFNTFSPSLDFASDVIAYQAAIIAIAIPLSLEIISRISERYQSGVITKEFNRQWQLGLLLLLGIVVLVLSYFVNNCYYTLNLKNYRNAHKNLDPRSY